MSGHIRNYLAAFGAFLLIWVGFQWILPLAAPFLLGWLFAYLAKPITESLHGKLGFHRGLASGIGVTAVLLSLSGLLLLILSVCFRELTVLAKELPEYGCLMGRQLDNMKTWVVSLAARIPGSLGETLSQGASELFSGGSVVAERMTSGMISAAGSVAGRLPGGAITLGTAVISGYMISAQYPRLRLWIAREMPWMEKWRVWFRELWDTLRQWLSAQLKLSGLTFLLVGGGFLLLRVERPLLWALVTAVVDAVPILGTGTVLIPMSLIALLLGRQVQALGLAALYITAMMTRSALEPKLVGRELGLNPLVTLMALYVGYRLWGIPGMILSPILAVTVRRLIQR